MARTEVVMPQMGESIAEGTIVKWYKKVGESVKKDETLLEISTDKVDSEIPSPAAGVVAEIVVPEQKTVPVRTVIAYIETNGGGAKTAAPQATQPKPAAVEAVPTPAVAPRAERPAAPASGRFYSPLVLNIARVEGIGMSELETIPGTGEGGRLSKKDVLAYVEMRKSGGAPPRAAGTSRPAPVGISAGPSDDADLKKKYPLINSSIEGNTIIKKNFINLGLAVASENGLIVPVIKHAEEKNFLGLARAVSDLAARTRNKKLSPDDIQGGTFTISNYGVFGTDFGTPLINQPQVAILGTGAIKKRVAVINDAIAIRSIAFFTLSFDHRIVDGALGGMFIAEIVQNLQSFDTTMKF